MDSPNRTLKITEETEATLFLRSHLSGKERSPTDEELETLGYVSRRALYLRRKEMLAALGDDEELQEWPLGHLRYFLEHLTDYRHELPEEAIEGVRRILKWNEEPEPEPESAEKGNPA